MTATTIPDTATPAAARGEGRRWPLGPLLDTTRLTPAALAGQLGIGGNTVTLAADAGLSDRQADRWAIGLGLHPVLVWGWAWIDAAATPDTGQGRVAADLRGRIERGELRPGDPLPSGNTIARRWGVGHGTVSIVTAELAREGLIVAPGRGQRPVVAHPATALECRTCHVCGDPVEVGAEHYPHEPDCQLDLVGWCACDHPTHPRCCPTCPASEVGR